MIGRLFGSKRREYTRTELIIFIQPIILTNPSDAAKNTSQQINNAIETYALQKYLETSKMDSLYVEESLIPDSIKLREEIQTEAEQQSRSVEQK